MKVCSKCGIEKSLEDFHRDSQRPEGVRSKCKVCIRQYMATPHAKAVKKAYASRPEVMETAAESRRKWREAHPNSYTEESRSWRARNREKIRAHRKLQKAVAAGRIQRRPCEVCGTFPSQAHHHDYSHPLDVRWLCHGHHMAEHAAIRGRKP